MSLVAGRLAWRLGGPGFNVLKRSCIALLALAALAVIAQPAAAASPKGVQHLHFRYGPLHIKPGSNLILGGYATAAEKPSEDGYITRIKPNLKTVSGAVPPTYKLHLHHGVFINMGSQDTSSPGLPERFFATGEEKTIFQIPAPYGYFNKASDRWLINYMIHDLTNKPYTVYITYDVDFVPLNSALGKKMKPVKPVWMDVENGHAYPVFDVLRGSGTNGKFTFPDQATNPYPNGRQLNQWTLPYSGTLVAVAGHLHPGGLYDDLMVVRPGAKVTRTRGGPVPGDVPSSVRIFRSTAHYFGGRNPDSWDVAMTGSLPKWRVHVNKGDVLRTTTTYETKLGSWYESMGIMVAYIAVDSHSGVDPFGHAVTWKGRITHGHLPENNVHGATAPAVANPLGLPTTTAPNNTVKIENFKYVPGDLSASGKAKDPPAIKQGQSLTFINTDGPPMAPFDLQISHSITACAAPCNLNTGVSYPIANGLGGFDSGQLGFGPAGFTAFNNQQTWQTPPDLKPGTYTYFCRIHPFMRGAFRVVTN
jgi:plastocyanin